MMRVEVLSNITLATLLGAVVFSAWRQRAALEQEMKRVEEEKKSVAAELAQEKKKREADRAGRIRAETSLRKIALGQKGEKEGSKSSTTAAVKDDAEDDTPQPEQSTQENEASSLPPSGYGGAMEMSPIGMLRSCYRKRFGTPRQGTVVAGGRGTLKMFSQNNPLMSCANLEEFSHVWLIYIFHENTNLAKGGGGSSVKSKIRPPRLGGEKVGLFATRTPHRPNAIGLSLVKLDRVEKGVLYLSGLDLIDRTPILDVKPYVPASDSIPPPQVRQAEWLSDPVVKPNSDAVCLQEAQEQLKYYVRELEFYDTYEEAWAAIREVLLNDIRSLHMRQTALASSSSASASAAAPSSASSSAPNFHFDNLLVYFRCSDSDPPLVEVTHVELCRVHKSE